MVNTSNQSLNKEIEFNVYNTRWGDYIHYCVSWTINGWNWTCVTNNGMNSGESDKEGLYLNSDPEFQEVSGPLFHGLKHESVFFPEEDVKYALSKLWEEADRGEIDYEELSIKLQELAGWISTIEKTVDETKPKWLD